MGKQSIVDSKREGRLRLSFSLSFSVEKRLLKFTI